MKTVLNWNREEIPEDLRSLLKGCYVFVSVDDVMELIVEEDVGLEIALVFIRAGRGVSCDDVQCRIDVIVE